jgi:hypothetical protein
VRQEESNLGARVRDLTWIAIPFLVYLVLLRRLWFDAPIGDDYEAILDGTMRLLDAPSLGEWVQGLVRQHNEHRIVVTRLVAWAMAELIGRIDFRMLILIGNLGLAALIFQLWIEFRDRAAAPLVAAAGFLLCHMTYYEGALLSMAASSNIGVLVLALACFQFAVRPGRWSLAFALAFGVVAAGTQANGLFALPLAAGACALRGERLRAGLLAAVALLVWSLYFANYQHPPHHGSPLEALRHPLAAAQLFVVIVGGLAPGVWPATVLGAALLAALAWLAFGGFWRQRPAIALWVAFILLSAAAAAAGRIAFGVFWASRYAINSSCLVAVVLLLVATRRDWPGRQAIAALVVAAIVSLGISWVIWPHAAAYSFRGRLLAKPLPDSPAVVAEPYFGVIFPTDWAGPVLARAEARNLYNAREVAVFAARLLASPSPPAPRRLGGALEKVAAEGTRVVASGWTDLAATMPGRTFTAHSPEVPRSSSLALVARNDIASLTGVSLLVFSGFRWEGQYPSEEQARRAARDLCLLVEAPGYGPTALPGNDACGPVTAAPS